MGAQDWIQVMTFIFVVSLFYWFFFWPMFIWTYDFAVYWANSWNDPYNLSDKIVEHADFVKLIFGVFAYFWIIYAIVWVYLKLLKKEKHEELWWVE